MRPSQSNYVEPYVNFIPKISAVNILPGWWNSPFHTEMFVTAKAEIADNLSFIQSRIERRNVLINHKRREERKKERITGRETSNPYASMFIASS